MNSKPMFDPRALLGQTVDERRAAAQRMEEDRQEARHNEGNRVSRLFWPDHLHHRHRTPEHRIPSPWENTPSGVRNHQHDVFSA